MDARMRAVVGKVPTAPGVYRFRDSRGTLLYVGRAVDLRHRVASYWSDLGDREHLSRMVARIARVEAVVCDSAHEAAWLERNLLERSMPRWNRTAGGQEVPVHIRLDPRPRRPGLSIVHLVVEAPGIRHFGPYLGGVRARQALAALDRILPLSYTGSGLTGTERDFGRQRGVSPADFEWVVDAVAAVLARNADATGRAQAALTELRNAAGAALKFELAGRIDDEARALDWITSAQRVTSEPGVNGVIHGWADGMLVEGRIRGGRLSEWTQRPSSEARARRQIDSTPDAWKEWVARNAELAAALVSAAA